MQKRKWLVKSALQSTALTTTICLMAPYSGSAMAQEADIEESSARSMETVVVTGTRRADRSAADSLIPIDVISGEELAKNGASDFTDILRTQVVSLNVQRFVTNDGAVFQRPFTLRGLAPDQTLLLVNGKRRHRAATIQFSRLPLTLGAQGPDLGTIPSNAIRQLEVLRDGASAQYGSDAIAGVVNLELAEDSDGFTLSTRYGQFFAGDGNDLQVQANLGLPLGQDGFFHVAGEYQTSDTTSRGAQRPDAQALIDAGNSDVANPAQRWGNPDAEAFRSFFNAGIELDESTEVYLFGNLAWSDSVTGFFYRNPETRTNVFASVPLTDSPGGDRFSFTEIFPGGFSPAFGAESWDWSLAAGVRGSIWGDVGYDLSVYHGENEVDYNISNTVNPSLGPASPTAFDPGTLEQRETTVNLDFVVPVEVGLVAPLNVAWGAEYHDEAYQVTTGDPASYEIGPFAAYIDPDTGLPGQALQVGSNGFPGFSQQESGEFDRWNYALYADVEADLTDRLSGGVAIRFEDFSDFGTTFNWKVAGRYEIVDGLAVRGSANTGFRAPTPGQANVSQTSTNINLDTGAVISSGIIPPTNPVAQFFGAQPLDVEESFNYAAGVVFDGLGDLSITIDYFNIELEDRISVSGDIPISDTERQALIDAGINAGGSFEEIRFFTNAFDTETEGVDVVATYPIAFANGSRLDLMASLNWTQTEVTEVRNPTAINRERTLEIEDFVPNTRGLLQANYQRGPLSALVRANYYGEWTDYGSNADGSGDQTFGEEVLVDLEVSYDARENLTLSIGAENVFDEFPDRDVRQGNINSGIIYPRFAPTGFNGGFWYVKATASF